MACGISLVNASLKTTNRIRRKGFCPLQLSSRHGRWDGQLDMGEIEIAQQVALCQRVTWPSDPFPLSALPISHSQHIYWSQLHSHRCTRYKPSRLTLTAPAQLSSRPCR